MYKKILFTNYVNSEVRQFNLVYTVTFNGHFGAKTLQHQPVA